MKKEKLDSLINDLKRAEKVGKEISEISIKLNDPIEEIIKYGLEHSIISSSSDVVYISRNTSEYITDRVSEMFDEHMRKEKEELSRRFSLADSEDFKYAGVYSSLEELNAKFGTDFNNRCIPNGVIIRRACR